MDIAAFEHDRSFVLGGLRRGEIDYLEPVSQAVEADLFRQLVGRGVLDRLAESFPSPRQKEEVPIWIYLASQLTLKLHGAAYHALPYVLRSGGLVTALGPEVGRQAVHPQTQDVSVACTGFNHKNHHDRETPCDQDFVRKLAGDTDVDQLLDWFNREVPRCLRSLKLFDPEGIFIGDASYVFVPDNEHYEKSVVLLFDQHNHPVDPDKVDVRDRRYQWRRCYKLVTLLHINRSQNLFLTVAARVLPGNQHECPVVYELVEDFVKAVDPGRMKILIVDRGLIDGAPIARLKRAHNIDTVVPLKKNMDLYQDVLGLAAQPDFPWEPYATPLPAPLPPPRHPVLARREQKRQQTLAAKKQPAAKNQDQESREQDTRNPPNQDSLAKDASPASLSAPSQIQIGLVRGLTTWTQCDVPVSVLLNRETDAQGETRDWALATTSGTMSGPEIRSTYALRPAIEERHRQYKSFWDLASVTSCKFSLVVNHVLFILLAYTLLQAHLLLRHRQEMNTRTRRRQFDILRPSLEVIAVYYQQRFCWLSPTEFAVILLELNEEARAKLLPKMKALQRDVYHLLQNARPP